MFNSSHKCMLSHCILGKCSFLTVGNCSFCSWEQEFLNLGTAVFGIQKLLFLIAGTIVSSNGNCRFFKRERPFPLMGTDSNTYMGLIDY